MLLLVTHYTTDAGVNDFDMQLIKMDENGNVLWSQSYENRGMEHGHGVSQCSDGGYILTGLTSEYWGGESDIFIVKTDNMGNEMWSKTIGGEYHDIGNAVIHTSDNHYLITGSLDSDLCLLKLNNEGTILYSYKVGGNGDDSGGDLMQLDDGNYIVTGYTDSFGNGGYDVWLLELSTTENNPPNTPQRPSGPSSGRPDTEYTFTTSTTDPDGDQLYYKWDWGDGNFSDWLDTNQATYSWTGEDNYTIRVMARDEHGGESDWSDPMPFSTPKDNFDLLFIGFLKNHPYLFPILRYILGL